MQDGRTDTRISTSSLPASRHDCPQYSCPFATLQRHGMCAHCFVIRFAISNSPVEKSPGPSTDCTRFSKGRLLRKRKVFRNLGSVIGRPELSHVSTEGGRVGIWTRHLLADGQQTSAPKRQRRTTIFWHERNRPNHPSVALRSFGGNCPASSGKTPAHRAREFCACARQLRFHGAHWHF
jgi:hypothetical protein